MNIKPMIKFAAFMILGCSSFLYADNERLLTPEQKDSVKKIMQQQLKGHPRLLMKQGAESDIKALISKDAIYANMYQVIMLEADKMIDLAPCERVMTGKRLLGVSREALRRIFYLSFAHRMTGDKKYLQKAQDELLAVSRFDDWNPSHFLDVAEMSLAVALGYDWLYQSLSPEVRTEVENALWEKGMKAGNTGTKTWWAKTTNNWNQVCHGGLIAASLANYEKDPELAETLITRALEYLPVAMAEYAPKGVYNEGLGYWEYGTTYNVIAIDLLEKALKSDFGLLKMPGFLNTGAYSQQMFTSALNKFNYSDNGGGLGMFDPAVLWFYGKTKDNALLYQTKRLCQLDKKYFDRHWAKNRFAPLALLWGSLAPLHNAKEPKELAWIGEGSNPVTVFRSSWSDPNALYLGTKLGRGDISHGHLDVGSFFFEADGIPWAIDLGGENYNNLESKNVAIWGKDRWTVFRYKNINHNTLTVNGALHHEKGEAKIDKSGLKEEKMFVTSDLSNLFDEVSSVKRSVALVDKKFAYIEDHIELAEFPVALTWTMMTRAEKISFPKENQAVLEAKGKKLYLYVDATVPVKMSVEEAVAERPFESDNKDCKALRLKLDLPGGKIETLKVYLSPRTPLSSLPKVNLQ